MTFLSILRGYLVLQGMALVGLPLAFALLRRLPSRGYAAAKPLGLLLTGVVFWWGGILHLWPNTAAGVLAAATLVVGGGLWALRGAWPDLGGWWRRHRTHVWVTEGLFLIALAAWAVVRASQPQIQTAGGEKWMEIAFLNAVLRAPFMPPHDPWLSGFAISYYYLGYLLLGVLTRLTALPPTVAFNLGNAAWFALAAVTAYGVVYDLAPRRPWRALLAPLLLLLTGNGEGLLEVLHARGLLSPAFWRWLDIGKLREPPQPPFSWVPHRFIWWWQASRTLQDRTPWGDVLEMIDEFPAFSFLLGDMHPHLLALPFVLLAVVLALNITRAARGGAVEPDRHAVGRWLPLLVAYGLVVGALGFLNTWDFPIYWALMVAAWVLGRYEATRESAPLSWSTLGQVVWQALPGAVTLGVLSVGLYLPFWLALRSQAGGVLPNLFSATRIQQFAVMFLPLLLPVAGAVTAAAHRRGVRWTRGVGTGLLLLVGVAVAGLVLGFPAAYPYLQAIVRGEAVQGYNLPLDMALAALVGRLRHPWTALLLAVGGGTVVHALLRPLPAQAEERGPDEVAARGGDDAFPLLLIAVGLALTLAPEFLYLKDVFMTRMNTIFKFYFQAWVVWSLAGAWQLMRWWDARPGRGARIALVLASLFIAAGLLYTVLAVPARAREQGVPWTLDGADWLATRAPEDYAAIQWLNGHVSGAPVIAEAPASEHRAYVYEGRVSAFTGLPTVLGWGGHEMQWRGNYDEPARREVDLDGLFRGTDLTMAEAVIRRYRIAYIYVGPTERQRYGARALEKFEGRFPAVYRQGAVVIYDTRAVWASAP